jgi:hypothetical protein
MGERFLANVALDHNLLFEFFLTFARFEFALKAAGFVFGDLQRARPDWDRFGRSLDLDTARRDPSCAAAVEYFSLHPPWRQVVTAEGLAWDSTVGFATVECMEQVLDLVRRVRNNLFHGGKFSDEVHGGPNRNDRLLRHSLAILHRCLELSPRVAADYDSASL